MIVAAAVVLYYPEPDIVQKIGAYALFCDLVIVIDNTDRVDRSQEFGRIPRVCYKSLGKNNGIATALNVAAHIAKCNNCSWMIMLDQDSKLTQHTHTLMTRYIHEIGTELLGLLTPIQISTDLYQHKPHYLSETREVSHAMTSGSVLSLDAYSRCGRFEDKLFIDHVDSEYCLRLKLAGYRVVELSQVFLDHSLGVVIHRRFLGAQIRFVSHQPFRSYYYVRNGCYVAAKFFLFRPQFLMWLCMQIGKDVVKALFFQDEKLLRLRMMSLGFVHFVFGRYGPLIRC
jgi:rhamnosyltransferase